MRDIPTIDIPMRGAALALAALLTTTLLASLNVIAAEQYDSALLAYQGQVAVPRIATGVACSNKG